MLLSISGLMVLNDVVNGVFPTIQKWFHMLTKFPMRPLQKSQSCYYFFSYCNHLNMQKNAIDAHKIVL
jgi:hypothetical protein